MIKFPKKSLGQNFLHDEKVLSLIADLGQIKKSVASCPLPTLKIHPTLKLIISYFAILSQNFVH